MMLLSPQQRAVRALVVDIVPDRSPRQVTKPIVERITVEVTALLIGLSASDEGFKNEPMHVLLGTRLGLTFDHSQIDLRITATSRKDVLFQQSLSRAPLHDTTHTTEVGHLIDRIRRPWLPLLKARHG